jgi:hypothetical protein
MGLYRSIGAAAGDYTFSSDPNSKAEVLLVQLWSKESRVTYWAGSHNYWLNPVRAENSLLRVPRARLNQLGLTATTVDFKHGGGLDLFQPDLNRTARAVLWSLSHEPSSL